MVGNDILELIQDNLLGYQGVADSRALLNYANQGKDEIWGWLKTLDSDYFVGMSQSTDPTQTTYFPNLTVNQRTYTTPSDLREIKFIECLTPGFTTLKFVYAKQTDEQYRRERFESNETSSPTPNQEQFLYTIIGQNQFVLASYVPTTLNVVLWYTHSLADMEPNTNIDQILPPYSKKIAEYAAKKAMIGAQDAGQFDRWRQEWKDSLILVTQEAGPRNQADPVFVQSMDDEW